MSAYTRSIDAKKEAYQIADERGRSVWDDNGILRMSENDKDRKILHECGALEYYYLSTLLIEDNKEK